uniref:Uncharacterized protein n=1 Tax=Cyclopterus lumpus TaxID=8103 RepID=A0A8C2WVL8_CYCLU
MKFIILCLCLASTACAAPSIFHYLPHYAGSRQQVPPSQVTIFSFKNVIQTSSNCSLLFIDFSFFFFFFLQSFGFIKYSIPQPPGRQSVEVVSLFPLFSDYHTLLGLNNTLIINSRCMFDKVHNLFGEYLFIYVCDSPVFTFSVLPL